MALPRKTALTLALLAIALIVAAWLALLKPPTTPALDASGVSERPEVTAPTGTIDTDARRVARARWDDRRARILAAHGRGARGDAQDSQASSRTSPRGSVEGDRSPDAAENGGDAVFNTFIEETTTLTQGCEELIGKKIASVQIEAHLIGAPEIGTIVESVAASGPMEGIDALTECLTEGMYTLQLGDAGTNFQRDAVLTLGLLDEVAGEGWLTPERVAEIRKQMIDGGLDPAEDPMVAISAEDPSSTP